MFAGWLGGRYVVTYVGPVYFTTPLKCTVGMVKILMHFVQK